VDNSVYFEIGAWLLGVLIIIALIIWGILFMSKNSEKHFVILLRYILALLQYPVILFGLYNLSKSQYAFKRYDGLPGDPINYEIALNSNVKLSLYILGLLIIINLVITKKKFKLKKETIFLVWIPIIIAIGLFILIKFLKINFINQSGGHP